MDSIVYYNSDQHKLKSYVIDLNDSNFENNLDAAIADTGKERDHINSGCIYSDIDNQQNPTLQLLSTVVNIKPTVSTID